MSRKRRQGKGRKEKARAAAAESSPWWLVQAQSCENGEVQCRHGCGTLPEPGSAVCRFMECLEDLLVGNTTPAEWREISVQQHHQVWTDATLQKSTIDVMLRVGTNTILSDQEETVTRAITVVFGIAILLLEHYEEQSDLSHRENITVARNNSHREEGNLIGGGERDALRFYAKRISCSCLKEKYTQAKKSLPKIGACDHCNRTRERKYLMVCGRCKLPQYCCRECQVSNWPGHKFFCDEAVRLKECTTKAKTDAA